jgi:hypothetical protein
MARYYGYYSNVARGKRKKADADAKIPCILEPELTDKAFRRNWARLIQKICEVDPLLCPRCFSEMRVISVIEDPDVIKKILKHLGSMGCKAQAAPDGQRPAHRCFSPYDEQPGSSADDYIRDPDYPSEKKRYPIAFHPIYFISYYDLS